MVEQDEQDQLVSDFDDLIGETEEPEVAETAPEPTVADEEPEVAETAPEVVSENEAPKRARRQRQPKVEEPVEPEIIRFRVIDSGLLFNKEVLVAGQVVEVERDSPAYLLTLDGDGNSWIDLATDPEAQLNRWRRHLIEPAG